MKRLVYLSITIVLLAGLLPMEAGASQGTTDPRPRHERPGERLEPGDRRAFGRTAGRGGIPESVPGDERWADAFGAWGLNHEVSSLALGGNGRLYAGGWFGAAGDIELNRVGLWDGSAWSALGSGMDSEVYALAADAGGNLYAGGYFETAGGVTVNHIARWDGTAWSALGTGLNDAVMALAVDADGNLYAGGWFTAAGEVPVSSVAKWDGTAWSPLGSGVSGDVYALAADGSGNLYAGGYFITAGGVAAKHIAMWDGAAWSALGTGMSYDVDSLVVDGANLYAGGDFTTAGGVTVNHVARWDGSAWSALGSGTSGGVDTLAAGAGGGLYAGGDFTAAGGVLANGIAFWDGGAWSALGSGVDFYVSALAVDGADLYAGGWFHTAGGTAASHLALWDGSAWSALEMDWAAHGGGQGLASEAENLAADGSGGLYAGGPFFTAGGVLANRVARWDGSAWSALGSGLNHYVNALAAGGTNLYAAGSFTAAGGVPANHVAKWDGTAWSALGSGLTGGDVYALAVDAGGNLYAGGWFNSAGGGPAAGVAKWDGSAWSALGSGVTGGVYALAVDAGGNLYAGGYFPKAGGVTVNHVAKWDGSAWSALGSGMSWDVNVLVADGTNLYAGGAFSTAGGVPANHIARWDGSAWSALGSGVDDMVYALAAGGCGDLYAAGEFATAGGVAANQVARWDGSAWSALGSGLSAVDGATAYGLAVDAAGQLFVGGWFHAAGGTASNHIARWDMARPLSGAGFSWDPAAPVSGRPVTFTGTVQSGGPVHYAWQFDTGGLESVGRTEGSSQEVHTYDAPGDYLVSMWAWNECTALLVQQTVTVLPGDLVVTSSLDSGPGTLRQAIADVAPGGTITFAGDMEIYLASTLTIDHDMTIDGTGHSVTISGDTGNDGTGNVRVFNVNTGVTAALRYLTVTNGHAAGDDSASYGGGIYNSGDLTVTGCTLSGNYSSYYGGALYNDYVATLTVRDSTFSANNCPYFGAGIFNFSLLGVDNSTFAGNSAGQGGGISNVGIATVTNSTFAGNSATNRGGAIWFYGETLSVTNTTFSGNSAQSGGGIRVDTGAATVWNSLFTAASGGHCFGSIAGGSNLLDQGACGPDSVTSPTLLLGAPGSYGGGTQTYPLLPGSPAIDAGDGANCPASDQRGMARAGACDIGAFESQGFTLGALTGTPQSAPVGTAFALPLGLTVAANNPVEPVDGGVVTFTAPSTGPSTDPAVSVAAISGGAASQAVTANALAGGPYLVTPGARGATGSGTYALANTKAASTTTLTSAPNPSNYRQKVTFTATVSGGSGTPTGTVTFYEEMEGESESRVQIERGGLLGSVVPLVDGVAVFKTSSLLPGLHHMVAVYSGDAVHEGSTSNRDDQAVAGKPAVALQPVGQTVEATLPVTFTAEAVGYPVPSVQWQVSTDGGGSWSDVAGAVESDLTFTAEASQYGNRYRAVFTNVHGSATSNAALLTVHWPPAVTEDPANQTVDVGGTATFGAAADANPTATVQWQVSADGGATWGEVVGAVETTLTLYDVELAQDGTLYHAVFANYLGTATTDAALLTVSAVPLVPPEVTLDPLSQTVFAGEVVTFTAAAAGSPAPGVQWQESADGGATWANIADGISTTLAFTATDALSGHRYHAVFTNLAGQATTGAAVLTVTPSADLSVSLAGVLANGKITYTSVVTNGGPSAAQEVKWIDNLPAGTSFISATSTQGTCKVKNRVVTCTIGTMEPGAPVTITLVVKRTVSNVPIINTATVTSPTYDRDLLNNSVTVTIN